MIAFAVLAGLAAPAYPRARLLTLFLGLALFGALIESVQMIPSLGRTASFEDWIADIIAAGGVLLIIGSLRSVFGSAGSSPNPE